MQLHNKEAMNRSKDSMMLDDVPEILFEASFDERRDKSSHMVRGRSPKFNISQL